MSFQISPELEDNKLFFIQQKDIEDRLDPLFYVAVQNIKNNIVKKAKYRCDDLIKSCSINRGRFGHRPRNDPKFYNGEYPFLQTGDVVKASASNSSIEYTQTLNERGLKTSKLFQPPKLLFTIAANIADTAILDYPSCFPDSVVAIIPKNDNLTLEYLNYYLRLIKNYIVELAPYSAQRNLNNQQLAQVPIVIPPKAIQSKIVTIMETAYARKKQKEAEAIILLDSIDNYLLGELGIELPEQEENTIQSRIFTRQLSEVSGGRFDPISYLSGLEIFITGNYKSSKIGEFSVKIISGVGVGRQDQASEDEGIIQIRPTNMDSNGELKYDKNVLLPFGSGFDKINVDDVLFNNTNSQILVGKTSILKENRELFFSNHITKITVDKDQISPDYLVNILNSYQKHRVFYSICTNWNNQSGIGLDLLKSLSIPLPPLEKQNELADHIVGIRNQVKQLQQQAKEELKQANKEVKTMILGADAKKA
ncbi:MAG: restriction endonuclease [Candidatus Marinimicrobia bacterium]|jgi:restriction endonuclease S subunit|nr:restriction endonuclease [Candidatus Ruthturnera sp.]MBT6472297.1 restriction endonuclease [Candidatus Neomarinimicrobiota bacterium]